MIRVQDQPFDAGTELKRFTAGKTHAGGTALFVGTVRDRNNGVDVDALTLEHYPGMTEKALADIEFEARTRWPIDDVLVVHRVGRMLPGDDIVLVICSSAHRQAAFDACQFLMDWLKTKAPFWKLEEDGSSAKWVEERASDHEAASRWSKT